MTATIDSLIQKRFGVATEAGKSVPADGTVAQQLSHRSHRRFATRAVSDETFEIIMAAALSAPSKSDLQQASIIDVRDQRIRDEIQELVPAMPWMAQAPVFLVFCGDNRRLRRIAELRGKPFPNDTLDMFMNAAVDAALVMQSFITAAESMGLCCCPISLIRNKVEQLGAVLRLPEGVFPVAGLCVGYPDGEGRVSMRLPAAAIVHRDRYDAAGFEDQLAAYDARRATAEPTPQSKQKYVDRWGISDNYTWSEDKARQYSVPERHSFGSYVRGQGFSLK